MIDRTTKLRWRRKIRRRQRQIEDIGSNTEENLDKHFFRRLGRLYEVRRFILSWVMLFVVLMGALVIQTMALGDYYLKVSPIPGGIFSEGIIGSYTNSNPIFASSDVDSSVSKLIYSGLLTYSSDNQLVGDLASDWSVDKTGKVYTMNLRTDVKWHDGQQFTSKDVMFTYREIQNPDTRSPYFSSWQGIKLEAPDDYTIKFTLPNVLASFPYSLTTGIIPYHILYDVSPEDLRGELFNTISPVGTGPFKWADVEVRGDTAEDREQRIALSSYDQYHKGEPKLTEFIIRAFLNEEQLVEAFSEGELNSVAGAQSIQLTGGNAAENNIPLTGGVMIFLKNSSPVLADVKVRKALTMATSQKEIIENQTQNSIPVDGPLLPEHIGYRSDVTQLKYNVKKANALLDEAGWVRDSETGMRSKGGVSLKLNLHTLSSAEYASVANQVQRQWKNVGVELNVSSLDQRELQGVIDDRTYDVLLYGIVMGLDPDQFAYWHSTQADPRSQRRLNFSEYKSKTADSALESGRSRIDPELRAAKYLPFLQTWQADAPAIALYRPRYLYITHDKVYNFDQKGMNSPADRYSNVENWMIRTKRTSQ